MKFAIGLFTLLSLNIYAAGADNTSFENHIALLVREGNINNAEAEEKILQNKIKTQNSEERKVQARGIASTLSNVKVYKIVNDIIEIQQ